MPVINYRFISIDEECEKDIILYPPSMAPRSHSWFRRDSGTYIRMTDPKCFCLLDQFYVDLMIPTFPIKEERDSIYDWMTYLRKQMIERQQQRAAKAAGGRTTTTSEEGEIQGGINKFDIILMVYDSGDFDDDDDANKRDDDGKYVFNRCNNTSNQQLLLSDMNDGESRHGGQGSKIKIMGAATMEYYKNSQVGLMGYIVLHENYRGRGLGKVLHEEALIRIEMLANKYGGHNSVGETGTFKSPLRAIFAETNTPSAGDITPAQCLQRHTTLYNLGYRLVKFPYAQPPLEPKDVNSSFDDILLLVYFPYHDKESYRDDGKNDVKLERKSKRELMMRYCPWILDEEMNRINDGSNFDGHSNGIVRMKVDIPFNFVDEFYRITFLYDSNSDTSSSEEEDDDDDDDDHVSEKSSEEEMMIPNYHTANYYKLAHWFAHHRQQEREISEGAVEISLCPPSTKPWEDCKEILWPECKEWQEKREMEEQKVP